MINAGRAHTREQVAQHYDELDPFYRQLWGEHLHHGLWLTGEETPEEAVRQLLRIVLNKAGVSRGFEVCDVGCGYGASAKLIAEELDCRVTGYTVSSVQHAAAIRQKPAQGECLFLLQDWLDETGPVPEFDTVLAIESTEHMSDKPEIFQRAFRALRPGGSLVVCAWIARSKPGKWETSCLLRPICREGRLAGLGTEEEYCDWIHGSGFSELEVLDVSEKVRKTWTICLARLASFLARPSGWKAVTNQRMKDRIFALTVLRMWIAYRTGSLRYLLFSARRS